MLKYFIMGVLTITSIVVLAITGGYQHWYSTDKIPTNLDTISGYISICNLKECCHKNSDFSWIRYQRGCSDLRKSLKSKIHGQPFIIDPIVTSIRSHLANNEPSRALVLYFSGWTGTGKTYTSKLIASNLYKEGMKSRYVKFISAVHHFPRKLENQDQVASYKKKLRDMIRETVEQCERSLIIIDEIDKLPAGVIDALKPLIDFNWDVDDIIYRKAIFVLMSNTGSEKLKEFAYYMYKKGNNREDMAKNKVELEKVLKSEASIEDGGLSNSSVLDQNLISYFIPFLPLEREHVKQCIIDQIEAQNISLYENEQEEFIDNISNELTYFPNDSKLYSKSGCKSIYEKVSNHASLREEL